MTSEDTTAVAVVPQETTAIQSVSVTQVAKQLDMIRDLMGRVMKKGRHYGVIPGCGDKPTLLKSGAELLGVMFQLRPEFVHDTHELPGGHREVVSTCTLYTRGTGRAVGGGTGSCSTMESKYRYRKGERVCPKCGKPTILKSKYPPKNDRNAAPGWFCYAKRGGCGSEFAAADPAIVEQQTGRTENPDPADQFNTVVKMADKRSFVAAMLFATGASDYFTQDIEDLPENAGKMAVEAEAEVLDNEPPAGDEPPPPDDPNMPPPASAEEPPPSDKLIALKDRLAACKTNQDLSQAYKAMLAAGLSDVDQKDFRLAYAARQKAIAGRR
jgi:hypothetical protein